MQNYKNYRHLILLSILTLTLSSCGAGYYSSSEYSDNIYYRPSAEARMAKWKAEEEQYLAEHSMINSYFLMDSASGRIYLRDGVSYADLLHKFDRTTYNFNLTFGGWYNPWNPWFDPWYEPWYNPWYRPWYNPWYGPYAYGPYGPYGPWYRPWGPYPYYPGTVVYYGRSTRTGSGSYGFGHRTDGGLRAGSPGTGYFPASYSGSSSSHRTPYTGNRQATSRSSSKSSQSGSQYLRSSGPTGSSTSSSRQSATVGNRSSGSGYSGGGYSGGGHSGGGYSGGGYHGGGYSGGGSGGHGGGHR